MKKQLRHVALTLLVVLTGPAARLRAQEESTPPKAAAAATDQTKADDAQKPPELPLPVTTTLGAFTYMRLIEAWGPNLEPGDDACKRPCDGKEQDNTRCLRLAPRASTDTISVDAGSSLFLAYCPDDAHRKILSDTVKSLCVEYVVAGSSKQAATNGAATSQKTDPLHFTTGMPATLPLAITKQPADYALQIDVRPNGCDAPSRARRAVTVRRERYSLHWWPTLELTAVAYGKTRIPSARNQYLKGGVNVFFQDQSRPGDWFGAIVKRLGFSITFPEVNPQVTDTEISLGLVVCPVNHYLCGGVGWNQNGKVKDNRWFYVTVSGVDLIQTVRDAFGKNK